MLPEQGRIFLGWIRSYIIGKMCLQSNNYVEQYPVYTATVKYFTL